jgi:NAD(P)-dependent dehydrogenase (short-subunit alcohol dehydrogenase family)
MGRVDGKVAIVTGAASGIGEACARLFAKEGAAVVVADVQDAKGQAVAEVIRQAGGRAVFVHCDVARAADCEKAVAEATARFGGLDILHANAGVELDRILTDTTEAEWDRLLGVNLKGVFLSCRAAIPAMKVRGGGSIVITASVNGMQAEPRLAAYCASKGGAVMLAKSIAIDYALDRIRANALCPGWVQTAITESFFADPAQRRHWFGVSPAGHAACPEEIAPAAVFLASDDARFVTGAAWVVDGGLSAVLPGHRFDRED